VFRRTDARAHHVERAELDRDARHTDAPLRAQLTDLMAAVTMLDSGEHPLCAPDWNTLVAVDPPGLRATDRAAGMTRRQSLHAVLDVLDGGLRTPAADA
jgi:hypothetical protein